VWPFSFFSSAPVEASHTRTDLSSEPETIRVPSLENATDQTWSVWPFSFFSSAPVEASHTRTDLSSSQRRYGCHHWKMRRTRHSQCGHSALQLRARRGIPHPHRFVIRARDDTGAITGKCDGPDIVVSVAIQLFSSAPVEASHTRTDLSLSQRRYGCHHWKMRRTRHSQCGHSASSAPRPSRHPTPAQICHPSQRRYGCHHWKMRRTRHSQCGHSASSAPRPSRHPTPAQICHPSQRRYGCHHWKMRRTRHVSVAIQRLQLRARRGIPHPHRFVRRARDDTGAITGKCDGHGQSQCGHSASSAPRPSRHPTPAQICHPSQRRYGCRLWKMRHNTSRPIGMVISATLSPLFVIVKEGTRENWFFHI
jgi:hypothetical protein